MMHRLATSTVVIVVVVEVGSEMSDSSMELMLEAVEVLCHNTYLVMCDLLVLRPVATSGVATCYCRCRRRG